MVDGTYKYILKHGIPSEMEYGLYLSKVIAFRFFFQYLNLVLEKIYWNVDRQNQMECLY